jgi:hypothetical protein
MSDVVKPPKGQPGKGCPSQGAGVPAPEGLKSGGLAFWKEMNDTFDFTDEPARTRVLAECCRTIDLIDRLQATIDGSDDLRTRGSMQQIVQVPEVGEIRQARSLLASLIKSMGLVDTEDMQKSKAQYLSAVRSKAVSVRYGNKKAG